MRIVATADTLFGYEYRKTAASNKFQLSFF